MAYARLPGSDGKCAEASYLYPVPACQRVHYLT